MNNSRNLKHDKLLIESVDFSFPNKALINPAYRFNCEILDFKINYFKQVKL